VCGSDTERCCYCAEYACYVEFCERDYSCGVENVDWEVVEKGGSGQGQGEGHEGVEN